MKKTTIVLFLIVLVIIGVIAIIQNNNSKLTNSLPETNNYTETQTTKKSSSSSTTRSSYSSGTQSSFTNKYGTRTTVCAHPGCTNYIASSGDTNCCVTHSRKCLECGCYIDEDALYCMTCLTNAASKAFSNQP